MSTPKVMSLSPAAKALPPELVASLLQRAGSDSEAFVQGTGKVRRSFRAAILAGLIVAILNAAANATFAANATHELGGFSLGAANVPVVVGLIVAGLWSGARTSAFCILAAHRLLTALGRNSHLFYMLAGGAAALALAVVVHAIGDGLTPRVLAMETFSGVVAGFFYRLFAGIECSEA